jgi:hypothetical protein
MSYWLDMIGSYIIAATVILIVVSLNFYVSSSSCENTFSIIAQQNLSTTADIINNDFYKIGYRVSSNRITLADSTRIKFYADMDDNGTVDSLYYYSGTSSSLSGTPNPNDYLLYRIYNNQPATSSMVVTGFQLTYYDSLGNKIAYTNLTNQSYLNKIKSIEVYLRVESTDPIDGVYQGSEWLKKITPKNL